MALASCVQADFSVIRAGNKLAANGRERSSYKVIAETGPTTLFELARIMPGKGVIVAQARVDRRNTERIDRAATQLLAGAPAQKVVEAASEGDSEIDHRQYGVATFGSEAATFTGSEALDWAGGAGDRSVAVQGNTVVGPEVVQEALVAFQQAMSKPAAVLGDALITALEAGASQGGDKRCRKEQTALSAFVAVARSDDQTDTPSLWLAAPSQPIGGHNPVSILRDVYEEGRSSIPETSSGEDVGVHAAWWGLAALVLPLAGVFLWLARRGGRRASK